MLDCYSKVCSPLPSDTQDGVDGCPTHSQDSCENQGREDVLRYYWGRAAVNPEIMLAPKCMAGRYCKTLKGGLNLIRCQELSQEMVFVHFKKKLDKRSLDSCQPSRLLLHCPRTQKKREAAEHVLCTCQAQSCSNLLSNPTLQTRALGLGRFSDLLP